MHSLLKKFIESWLKRGLHQQTNKGQLIEQVDRPNYKTILIQVKLKDAPSGVF